VVTGPNDEDGRGAKALRGDALKDGIGVIDDVGCLEAQDADAQASEVSLPRSVLEHPLGVNGTVDFDHEPQLGTVEVDDVAGNHVLTAELETRSLSAPKILPEPRFGWRRVSAHPTGMGQLVTSCCPGLAWYRVEVGTSPHDIRSARRRYGCVETSIHAPRKASYGAQLHSESTGC